MNSFFIGKKSRPSFLVEVIPDKKIVSIYKPDKYSKNEEFYEKYSLGELIMTSKFNSIIFSKKPIPYTQVENSQSNRSNPFISSSVSGILNENSFVPMIILKIKNKIFILSKTISEITLSLTS
jgi:hypothetical protein